MIVLGKGSVIALICTISVLLNFFLLWRGRRRKEESGAGQKPDLPQRAVEDSCCYDRFLPREMLRLLNKKSYQDVAVGDQQYASSVIVEVNAANFREFAHDKQPDAIFTYINRMLNRIVPIVYRHNGLLESFSEGGFTAFYPEGREQAMVAVVSICETMNELSRRDPEYSAVTAGICYGPLMIGAVGHEMRTTLLVLSESRDFARFLQSIGAKYYARIIVSAEFMEGIRDSAKKFNYRLLGYIYLRTSKTVEKIYDVFDGDTAEVRNKKRKTKMVYEQGVSLFIEGQTAEARQHFIEVLKMDHCDRAAKEYLLRCDRQLNGGDKEHVPFIEVY